jgi:hypothetical protein
MALVGQIGVLVGCDACDPPVIVAASAVPPRRARGRWQRGKWPERADAGAAAFACINVFLSMLIDHLYGMVEIPHQHPCSSVTAAAKCETGLATGLIDQAMLSGCRYGLDCWRELSDHSLTPARARC